MRQTRKTNKEPIHEARFRLNVDYYGTFEKLKAAKVNPVIGGGRSSKWSDGPEAQITVSFNADKERNEVTLKEKMGFVTGVFCPLNHNVADIYNNCSKCSAFRDSNPENRSIDCVHSEAPLFYSLSEVWPDIREEPKFKALISKTLVQIYFERKEDLSPAILKLQPLIIEAETQKPVENLATKLEYIPLTKKETEEMRKTQIINDLKIMYQLKKNQALTIIFSSLISDLQLIDDAGLQTKIKPILKKANDLFSQLNG